ncbi:hypothetical protein MDA_GLEAN10013668 [Myotis davidii]|uniref:Uncharacterized protein n=1 Tax=Myotis davidii TaxID=225400 RepID=L5MAY8_MYODS|nr:hypothetical protein MDA_GLEAN10013668 [Myotis davidii]
MDQRRTPREPFLSSCSDFNSDPQWPELESTAAQDSEETLKGNSHAATTMWKRDNLCLSLTWRPVTPNACFSCPGWWCPLVRAPALENQRVTGSTRGQGRVPGL